MADTYEPRVYSVFRRLDRYAIPGISPKTALMAVLALALGACIWWGLGFAESAPEKTDAFRVTAEELSLERHAAVFEGLARDAAEGVPGAAAEASSYCGTWFSGLDQEDIAQLTEEAHERGITAATSDEEIYDAAVAAAEDAPERALSVMERAILGLVPFVFLIALRFERNGTSLEGEIRQLLWFRQSQKVFEYKERRA